MYTDDSTNGGIGEECPTYERLINDTSKVELELNRILNWAILQDLVSSSICFQGSQLFN